MTPKSEAPRKFPIWFIFYMAGILIGAGVCIYFLLHWASNQPRKKAGDSAQRSIVNTNTYHLNI
jgi:hypothetical protein